MRKRLLLLTIAVLCLGTFACADTYITSGCRACGFTTDIIDWGQLGPPGNFVNTPALVTSQPGLITDPLEADAQFNVWHTRAMSDLLFSE